MNIIIEPEFEQRAKQLHDIRGALVRETERFFADRQPSNVLEHPSIEISDERHVVHLPSGHVKFIIKGDEAHLVDLERR